MNNIENEIAKVRVLPVVNIPKIALAVPLAEALKKGGMPALEVTLRSDCSLDAIRAIKESDCGIFVGAGTVLSIDDAERALDCGADFIVSPGCDDRLIDFCLENGVPIYPGCATPTEIQHCISKGLETIKFFPSELSGGVAAIKLISGPFPKVRFIPTGGITLKNLSEYMTLPSVLACGGSFMAPADVVKGREFEKITELCRDAASKSQPTHIAKKNPRIGILSLNPCVDKTLFFEKLPHDGVNVPTSSFTQAGGKGVNVARVLKTLGEDACLFTMTAGKNGELIEKLLKEEALSFESVHVSGNSREYITVIDKCGKQVAFKEKGPQISADERKRIEGAFDKFLASGIEFLCIADTLACAELTDFYAYAVEAAKRMNVKTLVDIDGEALKLALCKKPDIIKPNLDEYSALMGVEAQKIDIAHEINALFKNGIRHPIISLGKDGAASCDENGSFSAKAVGTKEVSAVGCGDSFVAGIAFGCTHGLSWRECIAEASAAAAANCEDTLAARQSADKIAEKLKAVKFFDITNTKKGE